MKTKTKQTMKKALCLFLSALLLITSLPIESFAQEKRGRGRPKSIHGLKEGLPRVTSYELFGNMSPTETFKMLEKKGYIQLEGIYVDARDIYKVVEFSGGENLGKFGVGSGLAQEGDNLLLSLTSENIKLIRKEEMEKVFTPAPHMPKGYVIEVKPNGKIENPIYRLMNEIEVVKDGKPIRYMRNSGIDYKNSSIRSMYVTLRGGDQSNPIYYYEIKEGMGEDILREFKPAVLNEQQLRELIKYDLDGKLFSSSGVNYTEETVQAVRAKGGERVNRILSDGKLGPSDEVAKAGDFIITHSNGTESLVDLGTFVDEYQRLPELGENYFKVMHKTRSVALKKPMRVKFDDGVIRELKPWDVLEITPERVIMSDVSLNSGEILFRDVYRKTFQDLNNFMEGIYKALGPEEQKSFKTFVEREIAATKGLIRKEFAGILEEGTTRKASQESGELAEEAVQKVSKQALKAFTGTVIGIGLYLSFTIMNAPSAKAQNSKALTRGEILADLENSLGKVKDADEKAGILEKMIIFTDPRYETVIAADAIEGNGKLLEEMTSIMPKIRATGLTEDKAAEFIANLVTGNTKQKAQVEKRASEAIYNGIQNKPYSAPYIPDMLP